MIFLVGLDELNFRAPIPCRQCGSAMRLVGIEPHPKASSAVQLVTYECRCGKSMAQPELTRDEPEMTRGDAASH
jgi:hypothetical protein